MTQRMRSKQLPRLSGQVEVSVASEWDDGGGIGGGRVVQMDLTLLRDAVRHGAAEGTGITFCSCRASVLKHSFITSLRL